MDKYIKLDTAKKPCLIIYEFDVSRANPDFVRGITYAREGLDEVPLEDVAPVVHGWWEGRFHYCSICGEEAISCDNGPLHGRYFLTDYCPNCGAKMDGDAENVRIKNV